MSNFQHFHYENFPNHLFPIQKIVKLKAAVSRTALIAQALQGWGEKSIFYLIESFWRAKTWGQGYHFSAYLVNIIKARN